MTRRRGAAQSDAELVYNTRTGALFYNANGSEAGFGDGGGLITKLSGAPTLTYTDFSLV